MQFDNRKSYTMDELIEKYGMFNIDFKQYGNNKDGDLLLYLKTDADKVSVFISHNKLSKQDYLKLTEDEARKNTKFKFLKEVNEMELNISVLVHKTSDPNIPGGKYSMKSLSELINVQDLENRDIPEGYVDGIAYTILDEGMGATLYDGTYTFGSGGFINDLENKMKTSKEGTLDKSNLKLILEYYNDFILNEDELSV